MTAWKKIETVVESQKKPGSATSRQHSTKSQTESRSRIKQDLKSGQGVARSVTEIICRIQVRTRTN